MSLLLVNTVLRGEYVYFGREAADWRAQSTSYFQNAFSMVCVDGLQVDRCRESCITLLMVRVS